MNMRKLHGNSSSPLSLGPALLFPICQETPIAIKSNAYLADLLGKIPQTQYSWY